MEIKWWKESIAYQIYPRSFCDSNADGIGDLSVILGKLDYLQTLGVDLLWITPIFGSPNRDNGYDISDYQAINPEFGTLADVEALLASNYPVDQPDDIQRIALQPYEAQLYRLV